MNGHHLRGIQSHEAVQRMVMTFVDNAVDLVIAHDELTTFQLSEHAAKIKVDCQRRSLISNTNTTVGINDSFPLNDPKFQQNIALRKRLSYTVADENVEPIRHCDAIGRTTGNNNGHTKTLALTPLYNSSEYTPVYANRVTIINTSGEDEKWQQLSRKRAELLSKSNRYAAVDVNVGNANDAGLHQRNANEAVYALCRPHSCHQIVSPVSLRVDSEELQLLPSEYQKNYNKKENAAVEIKSQTISQNFGIQKSQTDSCIANTMGAVPQHRQTLFVPSKVNQAVSKTVENDIQTTCDTTISIQISEEGVSYVEGKTVCLYFIQNFYINLDANVCVFFCRLAEVQLLNGELLQRSRTEVVRIQHCGRTRFAERQNGNICENSFPKWSSGRSWMSCCR